MDIFVHRGPTGYETSDMEDVAELREQLDRVTTFAPLDDQAEVHLDIRGTWGEIRELLAQPCFKDIWFRPTQGVRNIPG